MKSTFSFSLALLFLVGCSGGDNIDSLDFIESEEARIAFSESSVECESLGDCPDFSGGLFSYQETTTVDDWGLTQQGYSIGVCSLQLIAPDKVLTNRHCLTSDTKFKGASCNGKIYIKFPKTNNFEAEAVHCDKVVDLSPSYIQDNPMQLDWAILKLKKSLERSFANQNTGGVEPDTSVKAYPVYYSSSDLYKDGANHTVAYGKIKRTECQTSTSTSFGVYHHKENPLFIANRCSEKIISGNSGSGLFNQNNDLIGVISFAVSEDFFEVKYSEDKSPAYLRQTVAGGTNLHCIDSFNSNQGSNCHFTGESLEDLATLGFGVFSHKAVEKKFADLRQEIVEENLSKINLSYSQAPDEVYDVLIFSESKFKNLPKNLVREALYPGMQSIFPHFPTCVSKSAPRSFEEDLAFMDSRSESNYTINSHAEIVLDRNAMKTAHYRFKYLKQGSLYSVRFARASSSLINEMNRREAELQSLDNSCKNSFLSEFYCPRHREKKREFKKWMRNLDILPSVLKNEELLKGSNQSFALELPLCE